MILSNLNLSSGVYFVKIKSENTKTSFTQKLIVK
ncbi:MAG: T9SS type A sorting domain-containing protein [Psychroflexus halocasei]